MLEHILDKPQAQLLNVFGVYDGRGVYAGRQRRSVDFVDLVPFKERDSGQQVVDHRRIRNLTQVSRQREQENLLPTSLDTIPKPGHGA